MGMSHERQSQPQELGRLDRIIKLGIGAGIVVSIVLLVAVVAMTAPIAAPSVELLPPLVFIAAVAAVVMATRRVGGSREGRRAN
jgi:formate/nitrite transporter FocA (FNT family)